MALDDRGMQNGGARSGTGMRQLLKKGPWTAIEDTILKEYVKKHGEGNWNAVQKNSGLMRCGKSCRLRWANHLRPNLKKGAFSPEEERIIIDLHARFGNKWARMAVQLPGRTDNEIKNYWNTRLKRRQRAGLPIYPQELQSQNQQETNQPQSLTSSPFDPQKATYNNPPSLPLLAMFNPSTMKSPITDQFPLNSNNIFRDPPNGLPLPPPPSMKNSHFSSSSTYVPNNNFGYGMSDARPMPMPPFQQQHYPNFSQTMRPFMGIPPNQNELISRIGFNSINYPSGQSSMPITTASSSENTGSDFGSSDANNYTDVVGLSQGNSGFLEDLLEESQTLTQNVQIEVNNFLDLKKDNDKQKGKSLWEEYELFVEEKVGDHQDEAILTEESVYSFGHGADVNLNNNSENSSPDPNVSPGIFWKNEGSFQEINQVDEDLMCLLDNFPLAATVPSWDDEKDDQKINSKIAIDDHHKAENQGEDSFKSQVAIATTSGTKKHDWELGGCCWNNMPSFC